MKVGSLARALGDGVGGLTNRATRMAFAGHWTFLLGKIAQCADMSEQPLDGAVALTGASSGIAPRDAARLADRRD